MPLRGRSPQSGIQSVETGGALLTALVASGAPMMLKDVAAAAGMPAAKAHRYLVSFIRVGLVEQDSTTGRYELGPLALQMGLAALGRLDAVRLAAPVLVALATEFGVTAAAAVWGNRGATIVRWEEPRNIVTVNVRIGAVMPLLRSATGRCFAAFLPTGTTDGIVADELRAAGRASRGLPRTRTAVRELLREVRETGLAQVAGDLIPGIDALSAPVFDHRGTAVLALTVLGYSGTFDSSPGGVVSTRLKQQAGTLSSRLGFAVTAVP